MTPLQDVRTKSRVAYELGRLHGSLPFGILAGLLFGGIAFLSAGGRSFVFVPVTVLASVLAAQLGGDVLRGARRGMIGGAVTLLMPLALLRPCCAGMATSEGASCCTMPSCCLGVGLALGLVFALLLPRTNSTWRAAAGMMLGVLGIAALRCGPLFFGEGIGLLGGLAAGVLVTSGVKRIVASRQVA